MNNLNSYAYAGSLQQSDRSLFSISIGVIAAHIALLVFACLNKNDPVPKITPPAQRLVVQTIALNDAPEERLAFIVEDPLPPPEPEPVIVEEVREEEPIVQTAPPVEEPIPEPVPPPEIESPAPVAEIAPPSPPSPPKPQEKPKPSPQKKKPEPKKPEPQKKKPEVKKKTPEKKKPEPPKPVKKTEKKPAPKEKSKPKQEKAQPKKPEAPKKDAAAEAAQAKRKAHLEQAQKNIAKIAQTRDKINSAKASAVAVADAPTRIESLQTEALIGDGKETLTKQELTYHQELAGRLKMQMRMPEYGEVKIKLTLQRSGTFVKVEIVHAESSANKKYVEKKLPTLTYPGFGSNFEGASQHTFTIVLSNDL